MCETFLIIINNLRKAQKKSISLLFSGQESWCLVANLVVGAMFNRKLVVKRYNSEHLAGERAKDYEGLLAEVIKCIVCEAHHHRQRQQVQGTCQPHHSKVMSLLRVLDITGACLFRSCRSWAKSNDEKDENKHPQDTEQQALWPLEIVVLVVFLMIVEYRNRRNRMANDDCSYWDHHL